MLPRVRLRHLLVVFIELSVFMILPKTCPVGTRVSIIRGEKAKFLYLSRFYEKMSSSASKTHAPAVMAPPTTASTTVGL